MDNSQKLVECITCEFFDICFNTVNDSDLEEFEDGSCKTKERFKVI